MGGGCHKDPRGWMYHVSALEASKIEIRHCWQSRDGLFQWRQHRWVQVIRSVHGSSLSKWHTAGKCTLSGLVLGSAFLDLGWKLKFGSLQTPQWRQNCLYECFPGLYRIAIKPKGSVADHWYHSSWTWSIRRHLEGEEIADFMSLLGLVTEKKIWSLEGSGVFSVKSLVKHLSFASPLNKQRENLFGKPKALTMLITSVNYTIW